MKLDEPREEYDFRGGARGRHAWLADATDNLRLLDPDLAALYPDSASVNEALRRLSPSPAGRRTKAAPRKSR